MSRYALPFLHTLHHFLPLKEYFIRNRWPLAFGILCLLSVDFLQLAIPLVIKKAIDSLTLKTASSFILLKYGMIIMAIALSMALFRFLWRHLLFGHSRKVEERLRNRLYKHLQSLSFSFYQRTKTGDLMARAINDLDAIRMATGMGLVALTDGLVLGMAAIGFMMYINVNLTLISLIPAPVIIYLTRIITRRMSKGYERIQTTFSDLTESVRESFAGIRVIKAYSRESWEHKKIETIGGKYVYENMKLAKTMAVFFPLMAIFTNLGLAIIIWLGGRLTILGHITTGDFVAFIGYLNLLTWPMMAMGWVTNIIQRGSASMRRINRILEEVPEITDPATPRHVSHIKGRIEFKGTGIKYPGKEDNALMDIHFTVEAGQTIALVGRVGSGKTSLLNTIPRILETTTGEVLIDGVNIQYLPLKTLRESIGFVTQEAVIFSDTIRNNVQFGRREISKESIEDVLKAVQIYEEIQDLKNGMDTLLGERGITLSGGQRQRLTIARALLSDPPILILDDSLSMVDTRTEEKILNRVLEFRKHKTSLIVSHRLATISRADLIVVLEGGRLVEMGDHKTLLDRGREYARLYRKQLLVQELENGIS